MITIAPVANTQHITIADFVRVITTVAGVSTTYLFSTAPYSITVPEIDASPFNGLGTLLQVGDVQRDIKSTANETIVTMIGIDTATLGWVLGQNVKGASIEMWHGFFDDTGALMKGEQLELLQGGVIQTLNGQTLTTIKANGGLYKFFTGYINTFTISEQWLDPLRSFVGTISVRAASTQMILQNRVAGRYTNNNAWQFFSPTDTAMNRVNFIETINYMFGSTTANPYAAITPVIHA